ncbi:hypothetical protein BDR26DRAFT_895981 [Obelidium mucronatum]|nr:hypothetical protein BDR26DRAFT_895981 [Obelidium mucronatum]
MADSTQITITTTTSSNTTTTIDATAASVSEARSSQAPGGLSPGLPAPTAPTAQGNNPITAAGSAAPAGLPPLSFSAATATHTAAHTGAAPTNLPAASAAAAAGLSLPAAAAIGAAVLLAVLGAVVAQVRRTKRSAKRPPARRPPPPLSKSASLEYLADAEDNTTPPARRPPSFELVGGTTARKVAASNENSYGFGRNEIPMETMPQPVFIDTLPEYLDGVGGVAYISDASESVIKTVGAASTTIVIPDCPLARADSEKAIVSTSDD